MNKNDVDEESAITNFTAGIDDADKRLDLFLTENIADWSRTQLQRLIGEDSVLVNGKPAKASLRLSTGDEIEVEFTESQTAKFEPENIPLNIVFEDEYLAVINKPAGMVVHPGAGNQSGTLANAIAWHFKFQTEDAELQNSDIGLESGTNHRVGIVHRLDKFTSGLIVVAKSEEIHEAISSQFRDRTVEKKYIALVHGNPRENLGVIDRPIARDRWQRTKMTVAAKGRNALSLWKVIRRYEKFALLEIEIKTGRTHQIRVHLASINDPVVGDETYNEGRDNTISDIKIRKAISDLNRFFLHAQHLSFDHPKTQERLEFTADLPEELRALLKIL